MKVADISVPLIGMLVIGILSAFLIKKNTERIVAERMSYQSYIYASRVVALGLDGTLLEESFGIHFFENAEEEQPRLVVSIASKGCQPCSEMLFDELDSIFPEYKSDSRIIIWNPIESGEVPALSKTTKENLKNTTVLFIYKGGRVEHSFVPSSNYPQDTEHYLRLVRSSIIN